MKRNYNTRNKTHNTVNPDYISPNKIKNYLMKDTLLDYLKEYQINNDDDPYDINPKKRAKFNPFINNKTNTNNNKTNTSNNDNQSVNEDKLSFFKFITDEGNKFELLIYNYLASRYNTVQIVKSYEDVYKLSSVTDTEYHINIQTPIIFQGLLSSSKLRMFGCIDFLVRSDVFYQLFKSTLPDYKIQSHNGKYLYEIIDVKHSTLKLASNGYNILNSDRYPAYKGQLYIYLALLNEVQHTTSNRAYLFGKAYNYTTCGKQFKGPALFNKIGVIDFDNYDIKYHDMVSNAIQWYNNVCDHGDTWQLLPTPTIPELYPNMKNTGTHWDTFKKNLSIALGEITSIYYCGITRRNNCLTHKINSWYDKNCNSYTLGFNENSIVGKHIDVILDINRHKVKRIDYGTLEVDKTWRPKADTMDFFIDFETVNGDYGQCYFYIDENNELVSKKTESSNYTFMIGIGYHCVIDNTWNYKCFYLDTLTDQLERQMFLDVEHYIKDTMRKYNYRKHRLIHWTHAEITFLNKFKQKWTPRPKLNMHFYDLYKTFYKNYVAVKGAFNYSLKSIGNAMHELGLIDLTWDNATCNNGLDCMIQAIHLYNSNNVNADTFNTIIKYNEIDCKMMYLIYNNIINATST